MCSLKENVLLYQIMKNGAIFLLFFPADFVCAWFIIRDVGSFSFAAADQLVLGFRRGLRVRF